MISFIEMYNGCTKSTGIKLGVLFRIEKGEVNFIYKISTDRDIRNLLKFVFLNQKFIRLLCCGV